MTGTSSRIIDVFGVPGFDPDGHVWAQAPDHVIETARALSRAGDDPKADRTRM